MPWPSSHSARSPETWPEPLSESSLGLCRTLAPSQPDAASASSSVSATSPARMLAQSFQATTWRLKSSRVSQWNANGPRDIGER